MTPSAQKDNPLRQLVRRTAGLRPISWFYARTLHHIDRGVYRISNGRSTFSSWVGGLPVVMLTTTGAKSGKSRTLPLLGFDEGEDVVLIASNWGQRHHPSWYHNLRAHPRATIVVDGQRREVEASMVSEADRDRYFKRAIATYPGYAYYRRRAGREIPILRLRPADRDAS
jgi:deazaflavin-dependent oxidoreductase (nitroreductase family)